MRILRIVFVGVLFWGILHQTAILQAATLTWAGSADGNWNSAASWSPAQIPTSTDTLVLTTPVSARQIYSGNITLADGGSVTLAAGNDNTFTSYTGNLTMTGGSISLNEKRSLAGILAGTTNWNISGGSFSYTHSIGTQNGTFRFGTYWKGCTPTLTGDAVANLNISAASAGATTFYADRFILGYANGGMGSNSLTACMNLTGYADVKFGPSAGSEISSIGSGATAILTMKDHASLTSEGMLAIASRDSIGKILMSGYSTLNAKSSLLVGNGTVGQSLLSLSENAQVTTPVLTIGNNSNQQNLMEVKGASSVNVTGQLTVGLGSISNESVISNGNGTFNIDGGSVTTTKLTVGSGFSSGSLVTNSSGTMNLKSGSLTISDVLLIGTGDVATDTYYGTGVFTQSGGSFTVLKDVGIRKGSSVIISGGTKSEWQTKLNVWKGGTLNVSGGTGISFNELLVQPGGSANFSGGTVSAKKLTSNNQLVISDSANLTLNALTLNTASQLSVGGSANLTIASLAANTGSTITQTGGTIKLTGTLASTTNLNGGTTLSTNDMVIESLRTDPMAVTTVDGSALKAGGQLFVGFYEGKHGKLIVKSGSVNASYLQTGRYSNSVGFVEISGGSLSTTQGVRIGRNTEGYLTMRGGTLTVATEGSLEKACIFGYEGANSYGELQMTGGTINTTTQTGSSFVLGREGKGVATISQAEGATTYVKTFQLDLGQGVGSQGTLTFKGGTLEANDAYVGGSGQGTAIISGGNVTLANNLYVAQNSGSSGELTISGGNVKAAYFCIGYANGAIGNVNLTGGTLTVSQNFRVGLGNSASMAIAGTMGNVTAKNFFLIPGSSLTFTMNEGKLAKINATENATLSGGSINANFVSGLEFTNQTNWTLITNVNGTASSTILDSDYFKVSQDGNSIIASLRTDHLPENAVSRGVIQITPDSAFTFYTGLWDSPELLNDFVSWLNEKNSTLDAIPVDQGGVQVDLSELTSGWLLWDFDEFNALHGANAVFLTSTVAPEPATWLLLTFGLIGCGAVYRKRRV